MYPKLAKIIMDQRHCKDLFSNAVLLRTNNVIRKMHKKTIILADIAKVKQICFRYLWVSLPMYIV